MSGLYICSEQSDKKGKEQLKVLNKAKVSGVPKLDKINIKSNQLPECSHNSWDYVSKKLKKVQDKRKDVLRNTVIKTFDFGWYNEKFKKSSGKIDSFSALLYYSHILSDYLADNPQDTAVSVDGYDIPSYSGEDSIKIRSGTPSFTKKEKKKVTSYKKISKLDSYGRAGTAIANIGPDTLAPANSRQNIGNIKPSGWKQNKYDGLVSSKPPYLYNRCHLIAHQLVGVDKEENLITGTRYLNEAMIPYEEDVANYVRTTGNHVLYRATPIYQGDNLVAAGVQLEAYSIEDKGSGINFNVYLYNVQPGVEIDYRNGSNQLADEMKKNEKVIPFAVDNPNDNNPDLMYEIRKQLEILFEDQKNKSTYKSMMEELDSIAFEARHITEDKEWVMYQAVKKYQYEYMEALSKHVPKLLKKEKFFNKVFS